MSILGPNPSPAAARQDRASRIHRELPARSARSRRQVQRVVCGHARPRHEDLSEPEKTWVAQAVPKGGARQVLVTLAATPPSARRQPASWPRNVRANRQRQEPSVEADQRAADTFRVMCEQYINTELAGLRRGREVAIPLRSDWLGQVPQRTRVKRPGGRSSVGDCVERRPCAPAARWSSCYDREDRITGETGQDQKRARALGRTPRDGRRRAVFGSAAADGRFGLQVSPAAGLRDRTVGLTAQAMRRQRVLSDIEIRAICRLPLGVDFTGS